MSTRILLKKTGFNHLAPKGSALSIKAQAGEIYHFLDAQTNLPPKKSKKTIEGNDLIVTNLDDGTEVRILDYVTEHQNGAISVMCEAAAVGAVAAGGSSPWQSGGLWIAGGLGLAGAVAAAAGGGGGGGGGDSKVAIVEVVTPKITISSNKTTLKADEVVLLTFALSESSTDFTLNDVVVTGGTLSNFVGSGMSYTATFTPSAGATVAHISVANGVFTNVAGHANADGADGNNTVALTFDAVMPTIAVSANPSTINAVNKTLLVTFTLSEPSTSFRANDVVVTGGSLSNFAGGGTNYTATITADAFDTAVLVAVASNKFSDLDGNFNVDGDDANNSIRFVVPAPIVPVDTTPPTISISTAQPIEPTSTSRLVTFTLSEASTNFDASDVSVIGGTLSNFTGSGTTYSATVTAKKHGSDVTVAVASGKFSDEQGNLNPTDASARFFVPEITPTPTSVLISNSVSSFSRVENAATGTIFQATGKNVSAWSLSGDDASLFAIDATGNVKFITAPDFENANDANKDAIYQLTVNASNGADVATKDFTVKITDASELPPWLSANAPYGTTNKGVQSLLTADGVHSSWAGMSVANTPKTLTYSFQKAGAMYEDSAGMLTPVNGAYSEDAKSFIRSVFQHFGSLANLTFIENTSQSVLGADIRLFAGTADVLNVSNRTLGFAFQPDGSGRDYMGNLFFVTDSTGLEGLIYPAFTKSYSDEQNTIAHELAHALGLGHPFKAGQPNAGFYPFSDTAHQGSNFDGVSAGGAHNTSSTDAVMETIMTYHNPNNGPSPDAHTDLCTQTYTPWQPGIYDIAALQNLYGANYMTNAGNNQYIFNQDSPSYNTIWDGGGTDSIVHEGNNSAWINLNEGTLSCVGTTPGWQLKAGSSGDELVSVQVVRPSNGSVELSADRLSYVFTANMAQGGFDGHYEVIETYKDGSTYKPSHGYVASAVTQDSQYNLGIAFGVTIENATGGSAGDTIIGNSAANHITGNGGNDMLTGGDTFIFTDIFGQDTITDFTRGQDVLQFSSAMANAFSFSGSTLSVAGYGSVVLTGVTEMTLGVDYAYI